MSVTRPVSRVIPARAGSSADIAASAVDSLALENPPLLIVSDMVRFRIRTNWTNSVSRTHEFELDDLALPCTRMQGWTNQLPPCSVTAWSIRTRYYRPFVRLSRKLASSGLWRRRR